jgi:streptogramin lyase
MRIRHSRIYAVNPAASYPSAVHPHRCLRFCGGGFLALAWLAADTAPAQITNDALGTTALVVGPPAGTNSVVLAVTPATGAWTATANATWLHLSPANQSGTGSVNVIFSYDANPGATRSGTLTIAGLTLDVTQAGSTYVAAGTVTTLLAFEAEPVGTTPPVGTAVDGMGNVYAPYSPGPPSIPPLSVVEEWTVTNNAAKFLEFPGWIRDVAVDGAGNLYIADTYNDMIKKWAPADSNLTTLVSNVSPDGVAVDGVGNVYIADSGNNAIKQWTAANSNVTTLVSLGLNNPHGVAVDVAGNVYIADSGNNAIKQWTAANSNLITLVSAGLDNPEAVAVDGSGNVYIADTGYAMISEWTPANSNLTTLVSAGFGAPQSVAVDGGGNVYMAGFPSNFLEELPRAFVNPAPKLESLAASNDVLPAVLPAAENLLPPFAPTSDQSWLTITGITNGVVSFSFAADTGPARTANISLLGQTIPITQGVIGTPPTLTNWQMLSNGVIQFSFTNNPGAFFTVLSATNLSLPLSNWTDVGSPTNVGSGVFRFTSQPTTNEPHCFYTLRSP